MRKTKIKNNSMSIKRWQLTELIKNTGNESKKNNLKNKKIQNLN